MLDRDRLAKILAMTTSENDGEALSAVRRANKIIKDAGLAWTDVLAQQSVVTINIGKRNPPPGAFGLEPDDWKPPAEDWIAPHLCDQTVINEMFRAIWATETKENTDDGFWSWLSSVEGHWQRHANLTPLQYQGLRRAHLRAARAAGGAKPDLPSR